MTDYITGGWLHLSDDGTNSMFIKFKGLSANFEWIDVVIKHYKSGDRQGSHYGYWFGGLAWVFSFEELWFEDYADYQSFVRYLWDWQKANTIILKVFRSTGNYWAFDYTNEAYTVLCKNGLPTIEKKDGEQQIYFIKGVVFEQSG